MSQIAIAVGYLERELAAKSDQVVALRIRVEDQAQQIADLRQELAECDSRLAARAAAERPIDRTASFGRAVAQLKQMFPELVIEAREKPKEVYDG